MPRQPKDVAGAGVATWGAMVGPGQVKSCAQTQWGRRWLSPHMSHETLYLPLVKPVGVSSGSSIWFKMWSKRYDAKPLRGQAVGRGR